jgi:putative oxygen-independent coproporphyrinogen III oxidase
LFTDSRAATPLTTFGSPTAAYVHIPFCRRRCFYCDFPISVLGDAARGETSRTIDQYTSTLCQEIEATPKGSHPLTTIFLGGGTPSLLSVAQLERILQTLDRQIGFQPGAEISAEVDPGTLSLEQLQGYRRAGVNRLSLGAQAFQPELLGACGRSHTVPQIYETVDLIRQAGFKNLSLDLISGLPGQTLAQWQDSLTAAIALAPQHLSIYDLTVEPGTVFERRYQPGQFPLPTDDTAAAMYRLAAQTLASAGYEHYEISNYAQVGYQCRHNRIYWENRPYYGFGMGATSYTEGQRFSRPRTRQAYGQWVQSLLQSQGLLDCSVVTTQDVLLETLMLGLRLAEGLEVGALQEQFGATVVAQILGSLQPYQAQNLVEITAEPEVRIRLTDPEGFLFSNVVLVALWQALELNGS